jgi:seryl-tRNA synthetase
MNSTACAIGRTIIAILENYQQKDGSVKIPKILQKYTGFKEIKR